MSYLAQFIMIHVTGDTHGTFTRLTQPQNNIKKGDTIIICGDFGGVWSGSVSEQGKLNELANLPYTILFCSGNHENYDLLEYYDTEEWNGGLVRKIRENVMLLLRGQVYTIEGNKFFVFGGAKSHDIQDGILDPEEENFRIKYEELIERDANFRIKHISWWEEEMPSLEELITGIENLCKNNWEVDNVITHCCDEETTKELCKKTHREYEPDILINYFSIIKKKLKYKKWYCGHHHMEKNIEKTRVLYREIIELGK